MPVINHIYWHYVLYESLHKGITINTFSPGPSVDTGRPSSWRISRISLPSPCLWCRSPGPGGHSAASASRPEDTKKQIVTRAQKFGISSAVSSVSQRNWLCICSGSLTPHFLGKLDISTVFSPSLAGICDKVRPPWRARWQWSRNSKYLLWNRNPSPAGSRIIYHLHLVLTWEQ